MTAVQDPPTRTRTSRLERLTPRYGQIARTLTPRPRSTGQGALAWSTAVLALLIGWVMLYTLCLTSLEQSRDQSVLYAQFREQVSQATAPIGGAIEPGAPVGLLSIPAAGLRDSVLVEGTGSSELMSGPGHKRDTPLPGQAGVSVLYGRSSLFGGPFGDIADLRPGDPITVRTGEGLAKYVVDDVRRAGDPFPAAVAVGGGRLTLVTAEGDGWRSGWAPSHTVSVDATLASKAFGTPGGRPSAVPKVETALQGDSSALFLLVLWLPLLLGGAVAAVWMQDRWGRWQAWIVGFPVIVAGLWGVSESAVQLLPNLL